MAKIYQVSNPTFKDGGVEYFHTLAAARERAKELVASGDATAASVARVLIDDPSTDLVVRILNRARGWVREFTIVEEYGDA